MYVKTHNYAHYITDVVACRTGHGKYVEMSPKYTVTIKEIDTFNVVLTRNY
jgi:hypothetical protein